MNIRTLLPALVLATVFPLAGQDAAPATGEADAQAPADIGWPRDFKTATHTVVVFQPQVDEWQDYETLKLRMAVAISETGKEEEAQYGGLFADVTTDVDSESRQVLLTDRKATRLTFPGASEPEQERLTAILKEALPEQKDLIVSLDRIVAAVATSEQQMKEVEASMEVPPIYVSEGPALLMMFIGEPEFKPIGESGLLFATNTNWDVFMTTGGDAEYFLRYDTFWFTTKDPKGGTWNPVENLPAGFAKLPDDDNWTEVKENIPGTKSDVPMSVFYSDRPAELIVIDGKASLSPMVGASLMLVSNTDADLFFHAPTGTYYFLAAGRWYATKSLTDGEWAAAPEPLPAEFAMIPEDHERSHVLVSVPGTPAASEAVIMASIPERATVSREEATLEVTYEGEPQFSPIPGNEGVEFAVNTNFDVFKVNNYYYCCFQAVWFVAATPNGPWAVCDDVAAPIYDIPAEHPKHNVTYVAVESSTPTTVETSYTSGYQGTYVVRGLVMFGLGYWIAKDRYKYRYPSHYHYHYHCRPSWYGHGCRAVHYRGGYYRGGSRWYGPYGGAGRSAIYNPRTGGWARSAYAYGPRGSAYTRSAYNPYTNTFGRQTRVSTPYGTGTRGVVSRNGNWARGGTYSNRRGTVGGATGSRGGTIVGGNKRFGGQGGIAKTPGGDVYVGRNGEITKLDPNSGRWQTREGNSWKDAGPSSLKRTTGTGSSRPAIDTSRRPATLPSTRPTNPSTRPSTPSTRPSTPSAGTRPTTPSTRPTQPSSRPTQPSTRPTQPSTRPTNQPSSRPTQPSKRPSTPTRPSTTPSTRPSTGQLDRQAYSRHRGSANTSRSSTRSAPSRSSSRSAPSRGGGGRRR